jgi:hypothetical protein
VQYFICLDNCILVDVLEAIREGSEFKGWKELQALLKAKKATLLVTKVTLLEFERKIAEAEAQLLTARVQIENTIQNNVSKKLSPELELLLAGPLKEWNKKKGKVWRQAADSILKLLGTVEPIPFTPEIMCLYTARRISGRTPPPKSPKKLSEGESAKDAKNDQDCFLMDSLITFFGGKTNDKTLVFVTRDTDFGLVQKDGTGTLDGVFRDGLPPTQLFNDLEKAFEFVDSKGTVHVPTDAEEVEEALRHYTLEAEPGSFKLTPDYVTITITAEDHAKLKQMKNEQKKMEQEALLESLTSLLSSRTPRQEVRQSTIITAGGTGRTRTGGHLVAVPEPQVPAEPPKTKK